VYIYKIKMTAAISYHRRCPITTPFYLNWRDIVKLRPRPKPGMCVKYGTEYGTGVMQLMKSDARPSYDFRTEKEWTQATDDATQATDDATQATDDATQATDDATQATDDATQGTDDATQGTDDVTHYTGKSGKITSYIYTYIGKWEISFTHDEIPPPEIREEDRFIETTVQYLNQILYDKLAHYYNDAYIDNELLLDAASKVNDASEVNSAICEYMKSLNEYFGLDIQWTSYTDDASEQVRDPDPDPDPGQGNLTGVFQLDL